MPHSGSNTLTFPLGPWQGSRSYIQGVKWDGHRFLIGQSRKDAAGESVVIREHGADLKYTGKSYALLQAGHGSSFGVAPAGDGVTLVIVGHVRNGAGYYVAGHPTFNRLPGVPNGDITTDPDNDLLCVRNGSRYRGYTLGSCLRGEPVLLFDGRIRDWFKRFQGHLITRLDNGTITLLVHRDMATKGQSRLDQFSVVDGKLAKAGEFDTTNWGDEAEGAMVYDGSCWATSRVGGTGSGRTVVATRLPLNVWPPVYLPPMMVDPAKVQTFLWGVDHATGEKVHQRPPGFVIDTGVQFVTARDSAGVNREWLLTAAGFRYAVEFLKTAV